MKFLIIFIFVLISLHYVVIMKPAKKEDTIDDKELDALLKDPKYAGMADELMKGTGGTAADLLKGGSDADLLKGADAELSKGADADLLKGADADLLKGADADLLKGSDADLLKGADDIPKSKFKKKSFGGGKKSDLLKDDPLSSLDLLGKGGVDPLKELSMIETNSKETKKEEVKKEDDKFKAFDFISKQQARLLIEILKQPVFYNMLPQEAQQVVKV